MVFNCIGNVQGVGAKSVTVMGLVLFVLGGNLTQAMAYEPLMPDHQAIATPEEIVAELNRVRETPAAYAEWLETLRPYYDQATFRMPGEMGIRTVEGVYALDHAIAILSQQPSLPPLTLEGGLVESTQHHLSELLNHNRFTLTGLDGSTPMTRAEQYGTLAPGGKLTELLSQGFKSAEAIVASLVVDDGSFNRSTRSLLLNPDIATVGAGCGINRSEMPVCVFDYATAYNSEIPFIADIEPTPPNRSSATNASPSHPSDPVLLSSTDISTALPISTPSPIPSAQGANSDALSADAIDAMTMNSVWSGELSKAQLDRLAEDLVDETNRLRENPSAYSEKLIQLRPYYHGTLVQLPGQPVVEVIEGIAALDEAIAVLQNTPPLPTLAPSEGMSLAAADHARDLGTSDATGHYGSDNSDPFARMNRYGKWDQPGNSAGENISYGPPILAEWHIIQLLVDDNFPSRGHRQTLLNPDYRDMGAACYAHPTYRIVCDMTYASDYQENR